MTKPQPFGAPARWFTLAESRIPYYRVGRGPDVVFIHGWPLHAATFRNLVPLLADRFTCHLFDLPGTGASEWQADSRISLRDHAATVRALVDQLGLRRYALLAHDSGAVIAQLAAAEDTRVQGLVLGNTEIAGYRPWQLRLYVLMEEIPLGAQLFGASLQLRAIRHSSIAYGGCFADPAFCEGEFGELFVKPMRSARVFQGQRRLLQGFDWSVIDRLPETRARIHAPVSLVWGAKDPFFPVTRLTPTLGQFPGGAELHLIPEGKLFAHEDFPEAFAAHALRFLTRVNEAPLAHAAGSS